MTTAFLGLSHLGIVSSIGWGSLEQPVIAIDRDAGIVERLTKGDLPVHEPGLPELLAQSHTYITFSNDLRMVAECSLVIVARDVPTDEGNRGDVLPLLELIDGALPHLRPGAVLAVMSQSPPGLMRRLASRIRQQRPDLQFDPYYWVETLIFGDAVRRFLQPERFIIGCAEPSKALPEALAGPLGRFGCPILPMSYESAELAKIAVNVYLAGSIACANLFADVCEAGGANWSEVVPALRLDQRIGPKAYLKPGLGVAGGNLERDLTALRSLCEEQGVEHGYLRGLIEAHEDRGEWLKRKLEEYVFNRVNRPAIGIWGLTYKAHTGSTKNSPAFRLVEWLSGRAEVRAWDPVIGASDVAFPRLLQPTRDDAAVDTDALVIMADWEEFSRVDLATLARQMRHPVVIDCPGVLEGRRSEMKEIQYITMGRADRSK